MSLKNATLWVTNINRSRWTIYYLFYVTSTNVVVSTGYKNKRKPYVSSTMMECKNHLRSFLRIFASFIFLIHTQHSNQRKLVKISCDYNMVDYTIYIYIVKVNGKLRKLLLMHMYTRACARDLWIWNRSCIVTKKGREPYVHMISKMGICMFHYLCFVLMKKCCDIWNICDNFKIHLYYNVVFLILRKLRIRA